MHLTAEVLPSASFNYSLKFSCFFPPGFCWSAAGMMFSGVIHSKWVSEGQWLDRGAWQTWLLLWTRCFPSGDFSVPFKMKAVFLLQGLMGIILFPWVMNRYEDWSSVSTRVLDHNYIFLTLLRDPCFPAALSLLHHKSWPVCCALTQALEIIKSAFSTMFEKGPKTKQQVLFHAWGGYLILNPQGYRFSVGTLRDWIAAQGALGEN